MQNIQITSVGYYSVKLEQWAAVTDTGEFGEVEGKTLVIINSLFFDASSYPALQIFMLLTY